MPKEKKRTISVPVNVGDGYVDIELHSSFGLFGVHSAIQPDLSLSKKYWAITHIPSRHFVFTGVPWSSVASRIAKDLNQLMMRGIISREAQSSEAEIALSAFPGTFVSYLMKVRKELAAAKDCKELLKRLEELLATDFNSDIESIEQQTLFN